MADILLRALRPEDEPFIFNAIMLALRQVPPYKRMHGRAFMGLHEVIDRLLRTADVLVAADNEDAAHILGFAITEPEGGNPLRPVLHYVHVKRWARGNGIARALLKAALPGWGKERIWHSFNTRMMTTGLAEAWKSDHNEEPTWGPLPTAGFRPRVRENP